MVYDISCGIVKVFPILNLSAFDKRALYRYPTKQATNHRQAPFDARAPSLNGSSLASLYEYDPARAGRHKRFFTLIF